MDSIWKDVGEVAGSLMAFFGFSKLMNLSLSRRVKAIESDRDKHPRQTKADCEKEMTSCPIKFQVTAIEKRIDEQSAVYVREIQNVHAAIADLTKAVLKK